MPITNLEMAEQYGKLHGKIGKFAGRQVLHFLPDIRKLVEQTGSKTVLDYGCGKGKSIAKIARKCGNVEVTNYDPYFHPYSEHPKGLLFDGVICVDVMEHIPEDDVDDVLKDVYSLARKFVFFSISTREAKKKLPNGENTHCTVKSREWWNDKIVNAVGCEALIEGLVIKVRFD